MKLNCIAIDDEPKALDILKEYIEKIPFLNLAGTFRDSLMALDYLQQHKVDLLFLDINMPDLTGIQFLKSLLHQPLVIFTTAYSKYAVESYDFAAVDYLLKPIEFDRFLKASNKAIEKFELFRKNILYNNTKPGEADFIMVKCGTEIHKIKFEDILYIESAGNYVNFVKKDKDIMSLFSLNKLLQLLPQGQFYRIHKSFIIAIKHITKIEKNKLFIVDKEIPIGNVFKKSFLKAVNKESYHITENSI